LRKSKFEELCETHPELKEGVNSPGYDYSKDGVDYIEFHVDDHNKFQEKMADVPYGGNL
jgi:hypothetical protein